TDALTTAALQASGPNNGTTIIAIGSPTGYPTALDDDPTASAQDYSFFCTVGGTSGQATRLATATGGLYTQITDPAEITQSILDAVDSVLTAVDVSCTALGDITPFVTAIVPPIYEDVFLPSDPAKQVCVDFDVQLEGPPCGASQFLHEGKIEVQLNGTALDELPVTIAQPQCYVPVGLVLISVRRVDGVPFTGGDPDDLMWVGPGITLTVPFDQIPAFQIPSDVIFQGFSVFAQTVFNDPASFPSDPVKASPGLKVQLGVNNLGVNYGTGSGLDLKLGQPALLGGMFVLQSSLSP
ncbi:MAG TPA: hypothetical protein VK824_05455, partial [Planctomycetota bacterium]|nr:hypothetical protein [Planctomycetota bacterium]